MENILSNPPAKLCELVQKCIQKLIDFNASTNGWDISKADNPKDISNIANDIRELKKKEDALTHVQVRLLDNINFNWSPLPNKIATQHACPKRSSN